MEFSFFYRLCWPSRLQLRAEFLEEVKRPEREITVFQQMFRLRMRMALLLRPTYTFSKHPPLTEITQYQVMQNIGLKHNETALRRNNTPHITKEPRITENTKYQLKKQKNKVEYTSILTKVNITLELVLAKFQNNILLMPIGIGR
jgi:hypothetical protein